MTKLSIALTELAEKRDDVDVLGEMVQFVSQRMMDLDVEGSAGRSLRRARRPVEEPRNGYRDRLWGPRVGLRESCCAGRASARLQRSRAVSNPPCAYAGCAESLDHGVAK
jgi:putative transposase